MVNYSMPGHAFQHRRLDRFGLHDNTVIIADVFFHAIANFVIYDTMQVNGTL